MVDKYQPDQNNIKHLDKEASRLGMGGNSSPEVDENLYKKRMQKRKEIQLERVKERNLEKGLVIVFTGNGKGKTTAALGMGLRTLGHGHKVAIIQFIKGTWTTGEQKAFDMFSNLANLSINVASIEPVGPFLCFATIISALPLSSSSFE